MDDFIDLSTLFDPCIYVLMQGSQVVYVGQATNVYSRLQAHRNSRRLRWDRLLIRPCAQHDLLRLEAHYITTLKPIMNKQRPMPWPEKRIDLAALGLKIRTMKRRRV